MRVIDHMNVALGLLNLVLAVIFTRVGVEFPWLNFIAGMVCLGIGLMGLRYRAHHEGVE